jgi:hypothetical protein
MLPSKLELVGKLAVYTSNFETKFLLGVCHEKMETCSRAGMIA